MTKTGDNLSQCEQDAERARERLISSVEQLKQNLSPGPLANEIMSQSALGGEVLMNKVIHMAKENPLAVILLGLGAALLVAPRGDHARKAAHRTGESLDHNARRLKSRLGEPLAKASEAASEKVSGLMSSLGEKAEDLKSRAVDAAHSVADTSRDYASTGARYAKDQADAAGSSLSDARRSLADFIDEQPLVVAALGVAAGAALGAALPTTRTETRILGAASASIRGAAADLAADQYKRVKTAAMEAVEDVKNVATGAGEETRGEASRETASARGSARGVEKSGALETSQTSRDSSEGARRQTPTQEAGFAAGSSGAAGLAESRS